MKKKILGFFFGLMLLTSTTVSASSAGLESGVASTFGINRTVDSGLRSIAAQRVAQISVGANSSLATQPNFSHAGMMTTEVLAWNYGWPDPQGQAIQQWLTSAPHYAILVNRNLTRIGCADNVVNGVYFAVCALAYSNTGTGTTQSPSPTRTNPVTVAPTPTRGSEPQEPVTVLPNTSTLVGEADQ